MTNQQQEREARAVSAQALDWVLSGSVRDLPPMPDNLNGYGCDGCLYATLNACNSEQEVWNDRSEGYFDCALLGRGKVWGEDPVCTIQDWQQAARDEVARLRADAERTAAAAPASVQGVARIVAEGDLRGWLLTLKHARVFVTSRQKMHPDGVNLYDESIDDIESYLAAAPQAEPKHAFMGAAGLRVAGDIDNLRAEVAGQIAEIRTVLARVEETVGALADGVKGDDDE